MNRTRAFTLVELLVVIAIIALLIGLLLPALAKAQRNAKSLKDKTQIQQIHKGCITFANDNREKFPTPGQINRLADPSLGNQQIPGSGPEDFTANTTANLYSALIAQNFFSPELCYGTTEVNINIVPKRDYDFGEYVPADDKYWDSSFLGNPAGLLPGDGSNSSYSHLAMCGSRKKNAWRNNQASGIAAFGTRGTGGTYGPAENGGAITGDDYSNSPTLELHGPAQQWNGHVCFQDNHMETLQTFFSPGCTYYNPANLSQTKDNIYAAEFTDAPNGGNPQHSGDSWLVMNIAADLNGLDITPKWDPVVSSAP
jgi:prepilin-type N-terminal cleavage/methylation domain-containing protein